MKRLWKRGLIIILTVIIACSMISCSKDKKVSKGQYVEKELTLPEELGATQEASLTRGKDNTVYLIGADNNGLQVLFESKDNGQSWDKKTLNLPIEENKIFRGDAEVSENGDIFIRYNLFTKEEIEQCEKGSDSGNDAESEDGDFNRKQIMGERYIIIDKEGNSKELNLDYLKDTTGEIYYNFKFDKEGNILASSNNGEVVRIDSTTGKEIRSYLINEDYVANVTATENYLIVVTASKILKYRLEDGKEVGEIKSLDVSNILKGNVVSFSGNEEDSIYYASSGGVYNLDAEKDKTKKIMDSKSYNLENQNIAIQSMILYGKNSFLVIYVDMDKNQLILNNYEFSKNQVIDKDKEIKIFSLDKNSSIERAVAIFRKENPNVDVKIDVVSEDKSVGTVSDALKKLNTEIMAGNGPDIICLDGIDAEPYIEKGILEDISDVIKDYDENNLILSNVVDAYTDKGEIYKFPIGIALPVAIGENIGEIKDIDTLNKFFQQQFSENKRVLSIYNIETLFPSLCNIYSDEFIRGNNIDINKLEEFFEKVKEMKDIAIETTPTEEYQSYIEEKENFDIPGIWQDSYWSLALRAIPGAYPLQSVCSDSGSIDIGGFGSFDSLSELVSVRTKEKDLDYTILPSEDKSKFIPIGLVGINSKSKEKTLAKDFIHLLLSEDVQKCNFGENRFPVNISTLKKEKINDEHMEEGAKICVQNNDDKDIEFEHVWPSDEECEKLIDKIKNAKKPVDIKPTILVVLKDAFDKYDSGEISLKEAAKKVEKDTKLDLDE